MLFWNAPRQTDSVQNTAAPAVPRAPIEPPRAANRKPGLASATMKPSHQDMALISWRSSISAVAIDPSLRGHVVVEPPAGRRTNGNGTPGESRPRPAGARRGSGARRVRERGVDRGVHRVDALLDRGVDPDEGLLGRRDVLP